MKLLVYITMMFSFILSCSFSKYNEEASSKFQEFSNFYNNEQYDSLTTIMRSTKGDSNSSDTTGRFVLVEMGKLFKHKLGKINEGNLVESTVVFDTENGKLLETYFNTKFDNGIGVTILKFKIVNDHLKLNSYEFSSELLDEAFISQFQKLWGN